MCHMGILQERAEEAIERHGGLSKAARALNISLTVLCLLRKGKRKSASARTLRALGLKARRTIEIYDAKMGNGRQPSA
jgi:hypothetical protein